MDNVLTNAQWFLLIGALLLVRGLTVPLIRHLPITPAIVYLAVGLVVGPTVLDLFRLNPLEESGLLELLTEAAVLISLYAAGVKMPVPVSRASWRAPLMLATVSMTVTVALVAGFAHLALGLPLGAAILLGAIVAPTDPVLATDVQIRHPGDRDRLRLALTSEAGMNDGSAFPFVMLGLGLLGLHELGQFGMRWAIADVLWASTAGVAIGVLGGSVIARAVHGMRKADAAHGLLDDFLGLGLIGVVYGASELAGGWGFLAVFFAAVAVRQTEYRLGATAEATERPLGHGDGRATDVAAAAPTLSEGSLVFKEHLERLSELLLILLLGGTLFVDSWSWRAVAIALFLFLVARPISVLLALLGTSTSWRLRGLAAWFGVRGIGSLYYLMYAIQHGLPKDLALELTHLTLIVVTMSIVVHGCSVKPLLDRFWHSVRSMRGSGSHQPATRRLGETSRVAPLIPAAVPPEHKPVPPGDQGGGATGSGRS